MKVKIGGELNPDILMRRIKEERAGFKKIHIQAEIDTDMPRGKKSF